MELKNLVEEMVKAIVKKPEEVKIDELRGERVTVYQLSVAREDVGIVIGRGGRTATALRHLLFVAGAKLKRSVILGIAD